MPDQYAPTSLIQNSFTTGEISPDLYGRTDLQKYHSGALLAQNMFVDYRGGMKSRPGGQFIGVAGSSGFVRLIPFQFSSVIGQSYMLVFSALKLRFIKNPGGLSYPNSSNAGFVLTGGGSVYEISTPYAEADLPYIQFSQNADTMKLACRGYKRQLLSRLADNNWTLADISIVPTAPSAPTISSITISANPSGSTDPANTVYMYGVSAVDVDGNEGPVGWKISGAGINIGSTQGTVSIFWNSIAGAQFYKVYKALPTPGAKVPNGATEMGFAGFSYGTSFTDSNIVPDFAKQPLIENNPFTPGAITGYTITNAGSGYPALGTTLTVTDGTGTGAELIPIVDNSDVAGNGHITGIFIKNPGRNYSAPTVSAAGGGASFAATLSISPSTGIDPGVVSLFQQRQYWGATNNKPPGIIASRPGHLEDYRLTNPTVDNDALSFNIASPQVNQIIWMQPMPGGLVLATDGGILQLTGGSSTATNPLAITPSNAVIVPQSYYGAARLPPHPIVVDYDILYAQAEGSIIRDLQYNFFVNIYQGTDVTTLSTHLFYPHTIVSWCYQDSPNKVIWAVREDGHLLSFTFLKAQEVQAWTQHKQDIYGGGGFEAVASVREGAQDAVYYTNIGPNGERWICRMCDRVYTQIDDAWCLDAALSTAPSFPAASITLGGLSGNVLVTASAGVFNSGNVNGAIRSLVDGGRGYITQYFSPTQVAMTISADHPFSAVTTASQVWRLDNQITSVTGLTHLANRVVTAFIDGIGYPNLTVSGGGVLTLPVAGTSVVVGLPYLCALQPVPVDVQGEQTIQGRRKKITAFIARVKDSANVKMDRDFSAPRLWTAGRDSTDPAVYRAAPGLYTGDMRMVIDQFFNTDGLMAITQDGPYPLQVLSVIPEVAQGDTK